MKKLTSITGLILLMAILMSACGGAENPMNDPVNSELPAGEEPGLPQDEDGPIINLPGETPYQDREPEPGKAKLVEDNASVTEVQLLVMESFPVQVALQIAGELATPCNKLTVDISAPDADNRIMVEVYSLVDPAETCIAMIEPFSESISLPVSDLEDGTYEVWVNGELVGQFSYPG